MKAASTVSAGVRAFYQKDNRLNAIEYDYTNIKGALQERNIRIQELEQMLTSKR